MAETKVILAGVLIDGTGSAAKNNQAITIENGRIVKIEDAKAAQLEGAEVIDCQNQVVMPGLINCHIHCLNPVGLPGSVVDNLTTMERAYWGMRNLRDLLESGVTTVRNLGTMKNYDLEIKKSINEGLIEGPHMYCSGSCICMTGGHGWKSGLESDGVDECRKHARQQLKAGVDLIKIMATGGVMTDGVEPGSAQLTEEEMRAAIEEAHKANRRTATHAQGTEGIKNALRAGIDTVEHGIFLDEWCIDFMKEHGVWLVPTLVAPQCIVEAGVEKGVPAYAVRKSNYVIGYHVDSFKRAYAAGVKIAMGTDAGTPYNYHNNSAYELELMVKYGVSNMDALVISTRNGADAIGILEDFGTLEAGKVADILVLNENPLENISNIRSVSKVFKEGRMVVAKD